MVTSCYQTAPAGAPISTKKSYAPIHSRAGRLAIRFVSLHASGLGGALRAPLGPVAAPLVPRYALLPAPTPPRTSSAPQRQFQPSPRERIGRAVLWRFHPFGAGESARAASADGSAAPRGGRVGLSAISFLMARQ